MSFINDFLQIFLDNLNYGTIFFLMTLESTIVPVPSEVVMMPAGLKAATWELSLWWVILAWWLGSLLGAYINYFILGKYIGKPFLLKYGKYFLFNEKKYLKAEALFLKNDILYTFLGRLIPVVRGFISIPAGMFNMNFKYFTILTFIWATIWCTILALVGYYFWESMLEVFHKYTHEVALVVVVWVVIWWIYFILKKEK